MQFANREDAGRRLARQLIRYAKDNPLVLGLPRGGVPVAYEVARTLAAPLDVWVVRKVGAPDFPELGLGAVAEGGFVYVSPDTIRDVGAFEEDIREIVRRKSAEVAQRVRMYRGAREAPRLRGRTVIVVDDGIATGGTVRAAVQSIRAAHPARLVLAVPVAASQAIEELAPLVDEVVCLYATPTLHAIGLWYEEFGQTPDEEVVRLLALAREPQAAAASAGATVPAFDPQEVSIPIADGALRGTFSGPPAPIGLVLFAHGSGSSRLSPRNRHVASVLHHFGMATLLFDLLTSEEEALDAETAELRFDIDLLAGRLVHATDWSLTSALTRGLPVGYFGASTGAAAALVAAAQRPEHIRAVVSRGGRPDLAGDSLAHVRAPTLLLVGGQDLSVIELNEQAAAQLIAPHKLVIVPGATHLFEEPGTLDAVARLAGDWLRLHLGRAQPGRFASPGEAQPQG